MRGERRISCDQTGSSNLRGGLIIDGSVSFEQADSLKDARREKENKYRRIVEPSIRGPRYCPNALCWYLDPEEASLKRLE